MGSRKTHEGADKVYAAAQLWVDRALRADDSLFTPGESIWTLKWLDELRERFLDRPDVGNGSFFDKLQAQLTDSPPQVYRLMAEVLYVHFLIVHRSTLGGNAKEDRLNQVLGWSDQDIRIPPDLVGALSDGIAISEAFNRFRPYHVGFLIEFVEQWKEQQESRDIEHVLRDPWAFKRLVMRRGLRSVLLQDSQTTPRSQRHALLHLVYPDTFEGTVSVDQKLGIAGANAFAHFVTEPTDDVDRKIQQIRRGLEADLGRDFDFYDTDILARWNSSLDLWDEFIRRAKVMVDAGIIEIEGEKRYKSEIGEKLAAAREAMLKGSSEWPQLLRAGLTGTHHPLAWQASDRFRTWVGESSDNAQALREFWSKGSLSVIDRIRRFSSALPRDVASRPGLFTNLTSVLLMGLDAEKYPPFKITAFNNAYERTGYDMPERGADEAALYDHALGFLNQLIGEASKRGLPLSHRLDAQTVAYRTIVASLPELAIDEEVDPPEPLPPTPASGLPALAAQLHLPVEFLQEIETLLKEKLQVIFQGPPGTGKTYVAQKLARYLAGSEDRVTLVQFHPSYAYEDFVQGFRPTLKDGQPGFELRDGPLMRAAKAAQDDPDPDAKHFLIIDEINRGQIAKVLGELYFLLEYRDEEIRLQYSDEPFSLPSNLYIIGTMNTADRSIALVDLALRRRFYFVEFHPDDEPVKGVLRRWLKAKGLDGMEWVADVVESANEKMKDDRHAAVGPSYFMKDGLDDDAVERIWRHSVLPYVEERLFGEGDRVGEFDLDRLMAEISPHSDCIVDGLSRIDGHW